MAGAEFNLAELASTSGAPTVDTSVFNSANKGIASYRFNASGTAIAAAIGPRSNTGAFSGSNMLQGSFIGYFYAAAAPAADTQIMRAEANNNTSFSAASGQWAITYTSAGKLQLRGGNFFSGGVGVQIGSDTAVISTNTWHKLEIKVSALSTTNGVNLEALIDGVTIGTTTTAATNSIVNGMGTLWFGVLGATTLDIRFDDVVWDDVGTSYFSSGVEVAVLGKVPNGAGTYSEWDQGTGSTFAEVDDWAGATADDGDTTYIKNHATNPSRSTFAMASALIGSTVYAIKSVFRVRQESGVTLYGMMRNGSTDVYGGASPGNNYLPDMSSIGTSYVNRARIGTVDPNGGGALTAAGINTMELGLRTNTATAANRVTAFGMTIACVPDTSVSASITGVTATATATGVIGSISASQISSITGVAATATAAGIAGNPVPGTVTVGVTATATATGIAGSVTTVNISSITGVAAAALAAGVAGSLAFPFDASIAGVRATATALGIAGTAATGSIEGATATADAAGGASASGTVNIVSLVGVHATATASGAIGSSQVVPVDSELGFRIDIYEAGGTVKLGTGPIATGVSADYSNALDKIGEALFVIPANDPNATAIAGLTELWLYVIGEGYVFKGLTQSRKRSQGLISVQLLGIEHRIARKILDPDTKFNLASPASVVATCLEDTGWSMGQVDESVITYTSDASFRNAWQTMIDAGRVFGMHIRVDQINRVIDFGHFGDDSGLTLLQPEQSSTELNDNPDVAAILSGSLEQETIRLVNRIGTQGNGTGYSSITMEAANKGTNLFPDGLFERRSIQPLHASFSHQRFPFSVNSVPYVHPYAKGTVSGFEWFEDATGSDMNLGQTGRFYNDGDPFDSDCGNDVVQSFYQDAIFNTPDNTPPYSGLEFLELRWNTVGIVPTEWGARFGDLDELMWGESLGRTFRLNAQLSSRLTTLDPDIHVRILWGPDGPSAATSIVTVIPAEWNPLELEFTCNISGAKWPVVYFYKTSGDLFLDTIDVDAFSLVDTSFGYEVQILTGSDGRKLTYIEDADSIDENGLLAEYLNIKNTSPIEASWAGYVRAANAQVDIASQRLARVKDEVTTFTPDVNGLSSRRFKLGQKMDVKYYSEEDGINLQSALWTMGYSRTLDASSISRWSFTFSSIDLRSIDQAMLSASGISDVTSLSNDLGISNGEIAQSIPSTTLSDTGHYVDIPIDMRDVTSISKVTLELKKTSKGYAAYQIDVYNPEGVWQIYGANVSCFLALGVPNTGIPNPEGRARALQVTIAASNALPQYQLVLNNHIDSYVAFRALGDLSDAVNVLAIDFRQLVNAYATSPATTGITAAMAASWNGECDVIASLTLTAVSGPGQGAGSVRDSVKLDLTDFYRHWPTSVPWYESGDGDPSKYGPVVRVTQYGGDGNSTVEATLRASCYSLALKPTALTAPENLCSDDASLTPLPPGTTPPESSTDLPINLRITEDFSIAGTDSLTKTNMGYLYLGPRSDSSGNIWSSAPHGFQVIVGTYIKGHRPTIAGTYTWTLAAEVERPDPIPPDGPEHPNGDLNADEVWMGLSLWHTQPRDADLGATVCIGIWYAWGMDGGEFHIDFTQDTGYEFFGWLAEFEGIVDDEDPLDSTCTVAPGKIPDGRADKTYWENSGGLNITTNTANCLVIYVNDTTRGDAAGVTGRGYDDVAFQAYANGGAKTLYYFNSAISSMNILPNHSWFMEYFVASVAGPHNHDWEPDGAVYDSANGYEWAKNGGYGNGFIVAAAFKGRA